MRLLKGDNGWVRHLEGGVVYSLDVTRCMFSSGNVTERTRMGKLRASGETVVDLFAGIGYYTLPLLVHAGERLWFCICVSLCNKREGRHISGRKTLQSLPLLHILQCQHVSRHFEPFRTGNYLTTTRSQGSAQDEQNAKLPQCLVHTCNARLTATSTKQLLQQQVRL